MEHSSPNKKFDHQHFPLELFFSALNATIDSVVITDKVGRVIWINASFEQLTGYCYKEIIGENISILKSDKQSDDFYEKLWNTINTAEVWQGELWNRKKNGKEYLEEQTITPIVDDSNEITHHILIKRDITEISAFKKSVRHNQRMEALGQLTGGISHNFNNKLAVILGYSELVKERLAEIADPKLDKYIGKIIESGNQAKELVEQMQAFNRQSPMPYKEVSVVDMTNSAFNFVKASVPTSIQMDLTIADDLPSIKSDPAQFQQMIMSLVGNSVVALSGQGNISIELTRVNLLSSTCQGCLKAIEGDYIELIVRDNGHGISESNISKLFLPFFTTHQMEGGTGMGLSVLHTMLHEQNGHIRVESECNQGSSFKLLFPVVN